MPTLEWFPEQPHHLLEVDGETLEAGDTFEASEEDAEALLSNPEIRLSDPGAGGAKGSTSHSPTGTASSDGAAKAGPSTDKPNGDADAS